MDMSSHKRDVELPESRPSGEELTDSDLENVAGGVCGATNPCGGLTHICEVTS